MAKLSKFEVAKRDIFGRKVKALRRQGLVPANVFGHQVKSVAVQCDRGKFEQLYGQVGETGLFEVVIEGESKGRPVLIKHVQVDPVSDAVLHVDFHQVNLKEKITATIPVELTGESPAVKDLGGVLVEALSGIEVEALPTDLPDAITVDISTLAEIGASIHVGDLKLPEGVTLMTEPDSTVIIIQEQQQEEPEPEPVAEGEGEAEAAAEGETAGEGETEAAAE